ncbi:hypothetical protein K2173_023804 [Erythroxylum novogranatense]|uniref:Protein kinase domain-containing protein n=1 Tax=Erythroxylum novogranatense TaxID=1862640 RepID=A0AAV8TI18_9ROSI|nr:hypothetical protein K2173_023804 [Erythroxylum novogranatense]
MKRKSYCDTFSNALVCITFLVLITECLGGESSETEAFFSFVRAVDPQNALNLTWKDIAPHPCSHTLKGIRCNSQDTSIVEIKLENSSLSGVIDSSSLCKLQNLKVLSLANNFIRGNIPESILYCKKLTYLNVSNNLLSGSVAVGLTKLKHLKTLDLSRNYFVRDSPHLELKLRHLIEYSMDQSAQLQALQRMENNTDSEPRNQSSAVNSKKKDSKPTTVILFTVGSLIILIFILVACLATMRVNELAKEREILRTLAYSPQKTPFREPKQEVEPQEDCSELVFFVDEHERFKLDDLLEATADLRSQTICSSLFIIKLNNNVVYAVKRLKNLQASLDVFGQTMRQIGKLKHPNIMPLVAYTSTYDQKLLIYRYQINGSLLNLLQEYIEGKRAFPWKLRLSIASGIARGLAFIYQDSNDHEPIPHGNLRLSNILLDDNQAPLISEYGFLKLLDLSRSYLFPSHGYTAPERGLSEQGDVYSFGVILLELLTGKAVEISGIDLPKWVSSMVKEEWTGEVFDKEISQAPQFAFPLLNIALKSVSHSPEDRPPIAEILEKIEEIVHTNDDMFVASIGSRPSSPRDFSLLYTVIPETWDTPGSNY